MQFTCVDSFSGAGGLSLGLSQVGFEILLSFDIDQRCIETLRSNPKYFSHPALCDDIRNMLGGRLLETVGLKQGELFLLAGGPPCQGFSVQRIGEDTDSRNELVSLYGRLIDEVRPMFFIMENVSGIQGKRGKSILSDLISQMEAIGYIVHKQLIDARDYGVPQRRKRFILVGERVDIGSTYMFPQPINESYDFTHCNLTADDLEGFLNLVNKLLEYVELVGEIDVVMHDIIDSRYPLILPNVGMANETW